MRVAVVTQWYTDGLGYSENMLSDSLAKAGADVHIISGLSNVYAHTPKYDSIYRPVLGPPDAPPGRYATSGSAVLHRVASRNNVAEPGALARALADVQPDVVQTFAVTDTWSLDSARYCRGSQALLFTENHVHESVIPRGLWQTPRGWIVGAANHVRPWVRLINGTTQTCFAISEDTYRVAWRRLGVPRSKLATEPLGVDTELFRPPSRDACSERADQRRVLGVGRDEVLCIYTGRLSEDKAPHLLAEAVAAMRQDGVAIRALFVGAGRAEYVEKLRRTDGCTIAAFRPTSELAELYRAADVGVWPREESTSQLDAMASGLPIVISDRVQTRERLGVGATYHEGSATSLAAALSTLMTMQHRTEIGAIARSRVEAGLSWSSAATRRLAAYETALAHTVNLIT
jgi:glycosyltransferase involved in cell wall biosynthesis